MRRSRLLFGLLLLVLGVGMAAACGQGPREERLIVIARKYEFDPGTIRVKRGDTIRLTVKSEDVEHSIAIPELDVPETKIPAGGEARITFVPEEAGTFTGRCTVPGKGHENMRLTVEVKP